MDILKEIFDEPLISYNWCSKSKTHHVYVGICEGATKCDE